MWIPEELGVCGIIGIHRFHMESMWKPMQCAGEDAGNSWNPWSPYGIHMGWYDERAEQKV